MDDKLEKINDIIKAIESPFDRALSEILVEYEKKFEENEIWKKETLSTINSMEEDYKQECDYRGDDYYVEPPITNMDYIQACHENQGADYYEGSLNEELMAMHEMQIIYSFKQVEISLKKFVLLLEPNIELKKIQRWDDLKKKLNSFNVKVGEALGYSSVNQLREVNNALKHSHKVTDNVKKMNIKEFTNLEYFTPQSLALFHANFSNNKTVFLNNIANFVGLSIGLNTQDLSSFKSRSVYEKDMPDIPF
jgi:hypothetical protein